MTISTTEEPLASPRLMTFDRDHDHQGPLHQGARSMSQIVKLDVFFDQSRQHLHRLSPAGSGYDVLQAASSKRLSHTMKTTLRYLTPSCHVQRGHAKVITPTTYLDGVRGVASFIVYIFHVNPGMGFREIYPHMDLVPFLGAFWQGPSAVAIFLVVSGFAISCKPVRQIRQGDAVGFANTMASSVFRRWPRLYLPVFAVALFQALLAYAGLDQHQMGWFPPNLPQPSFAAQLTHMFNGLVWFANPLRAITNHGDPYSLKTGLDGTPWTLPFEFLGSMVVFLTLIATSRMTSRVRIIAVALFAVLCYHYMYWDIFLFLAGLLLAETHCIRHARPTPDLLPSLRSTPAEAEKRTQPPARSILSRAFWITNFIVAVYLFSIPPILGGPVPGFQIVWSFTSQAWLANGLVERVWTTIAGIYMMVVLELAGPLLQQLFTNRIAQYLGRISFSLYLIHSTAYKIVGWAVHDYALASLAAFPMLRALLSFTALTIAVLWLADLLTRLVDENVVVFNNWLYTMLCPAKPARVPLVS